MEKLKWAVCGASGMAGRKVVKDGLVCANNCELAAVHSIVEAEAKVESEKHGVPGFTSVDKMIAETDCDAVYIATPQFAHLEAVEIACSHNKHILCEKPLAANISDAEKIIDLCEKTGVRLGVDFNYRFHPLHQKMRQLIRSGAIGQVISGRCQFGQNVPPRDGAFRQTLKLSGGGAFADTGNHAVDLLENIMGQVAISLHGLKKNVIYKYECEDSCAALIDFDKGGFGIVDAYFCSPIESLRNDIEINGTEGTLYTENTLQMDTMGRLHLRTAEANEIFECPAEDMYKAVFEKFADAILNEKPLPITGEEGLHSQKIIAAVYKSSETGRKISIS